MLIRLAMEALMGLRARLAGEQNPERVMALRVAARRLEADMVAIMDQMCRLQVLEGAAMLPPGRWSNKPMQGLRAAEDHFGNTKLDPDWLQVRPTGMYRLLYKTLQGMLARSHISTMTADDLLQNALMGIGVDGERETKRVLPESGKYLKGKIEEGEETPLSVAGGLAGQLLKRKALNEINKVRRQQEITGPTVQDDSARGGVSDYTQWSSRYQIEALTEAMLDLHDPLGRLIRQAMRDSWRGKGYAKYMDRWLDLLEETGKKPGMRAIAEEFGIAEQSLTRPFQQAMAEFKALLDRDEALQSALEERFQHEGITASLKKDWASTL